VNKPVLPVLITWVVVLMLAVTGFTHPDVPRYQTLYVLSSPFASDALYENVAVAEVRVSPVEVTSHILANELAPEADKVFTPNEPFRSVPVIMDMAMGE
jgi:hypothetical protein